jgi:hypothetical protein
MPEQDFIDKAKAKYKAINSPVRCKCLNQDIHFNSDGLNHLIFNGLGSRRTIAEIKHKMRLIPLVVPVIKMANNASYEKIPVRLNRKKNSPMVLAEFWGIEASVGQGNPIRVRVVIRRVGNGNLYFRSVMQVKGNNTKSAT